MRCIHESTVEELIYEAFKKSGMDKFRGWDVKAVMGETGQLTIELRDGHSDGPLDREFVIHAVRGRMRL